MLTQRQNKELEATEERKRKAKQLEMQRKEMAKASRGAGGGGSARTPSYPTYNPPARPSVSDSYDSYEAEKNKTFNKYARSRAYGSRKLTNDRSAAPKGKGMQLGKKNKTTDAFKQIQGDVPLDEAPLVPTPQTSAPPQSDTAGRASLSGDAIHITVAESISAKLSREGQLKSFSVKGDLQLRISDPSFTKVKLDLQANPSHGAQFRTHPNVDKALFNSSKRIQLRDSSRGFPANNSVGVLRWSASAKEDDANVLPITFTVWVNKGEGENYTITVEYELTGGDSLRDVSVTIPYSTSEPVVSSFDAMYEVAGDSLEWTIGPVDEENASGSFEFEAQADDEGEFFPMKVTFAKTTPFVDVDVSTVTLMDEGEALMFSKDIKSVADSYLIE